jgi:NADH:ubiquinone oxidoreductase subunit F (NADH-binding)
MHDLLRRMTEGQATMADLALLEDLAPLLRDTSLCGLGQTAPNPVVSTLRYFRDEYLAHIQDRRCPAGVCAMAGVPVGAPA